MRGFNIKEDNVMGFDIGDIGKSIGKTFDKAVDFVKDNKGTIGAAALTLCTSGAAAPTAIQLAASDAKNEDSIIGKGLGELQDKLSGQEEIVKGSSLDTANIASALLGGSEDYSITASALGLDKNSSVFGSILGSKGSSLPSLAISCFGGSGDSGNIASTAIGALSGLIGGSGDSDNSNGIADAAGIAAKILPHIMGS